MSKETYEYKTGNVLVTLGTSQFKSSNPRTPGFPKLLPLHAYACIGKPVLLYTEISGD
jgi:hypothetical protein